MNIPMADETNPMKVMEYAYKEGLAPMLNIAAE
jgi:hypothetical protein